MDFRYPSDALGKSGAGAQNIPCRQPDRQNRKAIRVAGVQPE